MSDPSNIDYTSAWDTGASMSAGMGGGASTSFASGLLGALGSGGSAGGSSAIGGIASMFSGIIAMGVDKQNAATYGEAAGLAFDNLNITKASTEIQSLQQRRAETQSLGAQRTEVEGAGFAYGGTGSDLLHSSMEQGSLANALITDQGAIQENSYKAQQQADLAMQAAANAKGKQDLISSIAGGAQAVMGGASMVMGMMG